MGSQQACCLISTTRRWKEWKNRRLRAVTSINSHNSLFSFWTWADFYIQNPLTEEVFSLGGETCNPRASTYYNDSPSSSPKRPIITYFSVFKLGKGQYLDILRNIAHRIWVDSHTKKLKAYYCLLVKVGSNGGQVLHGVLTEVKFTVAVGSMGGTTWLLFP